MSLDSILVEEESETERVAQGKLIAAMAKILTAFDFDVQFSVKDGHVRRQELKGDSGRIYHPDLIASKGPWKIVCQARTRGQRGQSDKLDPGAVPWNTGGSTKIGGPFWYNRRYSSPPDCEPNSHLRYSLGKIDDPQNREAVRPIILRRQA